MATVLGDKVAILPVHPLPLQKLLFQFFDFLALRYALLVLQIDYVLLAFIGVDQIVDASNLLPILILLLFHFVLLLL